MGSQELLIRHVLDLEIRTVTGLKANFVSVFVADSSDDLLIHQDALEGALRLGPRKVDETIRCEFFAERVKAEFFQSSEASEIFTFNEMYFTFRTRCAVSKLTTRSKLQPYSTVFFGRSRLRFEKNLTF